MREMSKIEITRQWRKTPRGLVTNLYHKLKERNSVEFDLEWLHQFADCLKFDRLFREWEQSGFHKDKKPSIDRISNKIGYRKTNVQWLTWAENRFKQSMERRSRKGAVAQIKDNKVLKIYKSQRQAVLVTGISQGCMSMCLNGQRPKAGGYVWRFIHEHPELLNGNA